MRERQYRVIWTDRYGGLIRDIGPYKMREIAESVASERRYHGRKGRVYEVEPIELGAGFC